MSNNPFDRTIIHELEKPLADDINQLETNFDHALRFFIAALFAEPNTGTPLDGFLSTGLLVAAASPADMSVSVTAGLGFQLQPGVENAIDSVPGLNDLDTYKPIPLLANQVFTVPVAPVAPNTRIDIIEVMADRITTDPSLRQVFDEILGQFVPDTINKTLAWALDGRAAQVSAPSPSTAPLSYVIGQEGNPGGVPSTTPGYIKIAEIVVGSDVVSIPDAVITDLRDVLNERQILLHWPAADGFNGTGVTLPQAGGAVQVAGAAVWYINIGEGLEEGDIIDEIVTVFNKTDAGPGQTYSARLQRNEVDLSGGEPGTVLNNTVGYASTAAITTPGVYRIVHNAGNFPADFPHVWTEGSVMTMQYDSDPAQSDVLAVYAKVRRSLVKRIS